MRLLLACLALLVTANAAAQIYRWRWRNEICHPDYRSSASLYIESVAA